MATSLPLVTDGMAQHVLCTLAKLGQVSAKLTEECLQEHGGLRIRHYSVLQVLEVEGPQSQHDLATSLRMDAATMVTTIDDLENQRLATRTKDPRDRRRHVIKISDDGRALLAEVAGALDTLERAVLADISPAHLKQLTASLRRLNESSSLVTAYDATRRR